MLGGSFVACVALATTCLVMLGPSGAAWGEQAAEPVPAAGGLDVGALHSCAVLTSGGVRCWGYGGSGRLGYGTTASIGNDESPGLVGPVKLGGRTAKAIAAGAHHTCAMLDNDSVRCWGFGADGQLGYGSLQVAGNTPATTPDKLGAVNLGVGHTAKAISAGDFHTCAILDDGSVRCWGLGANGRLGYRNTANVRDPSLVGPVDLGEGRTAKAISAGGVHTCAILDDGNVRCWGFGGNSERFSDGNLGYGNTENVGDDETPGSLAPVKLGVGRTAVAISAGLAHTCAVLDDGNVRCWGSGVAGRLGYGNEANIGDTETPDAAGPVDLGSGRTAKAITAGDRHTCARLDDGTVRCWGLGSDGQLGYGNRNRIGDNETPAAAGPVSLGVGRTATALSAGRAHTCARLDDGGVRCWGAGLAGQLGYCNVNAIGDDEVPAVVGPIALGELPGGSDGCPRRAAPSQSTPSSARDAEAAGQEAARKQGFRRCLRAVAKHARRERGLSRRGSARRRFRMRRHLKRHARSGRKRCLRTFGRTPGPIRGLRARPLGKTRVELVFKAAGTDSDRPPPARSYVVRQSRRPIRGARGFARAQTLCKRFCRFTPSRVGGTISLTITSLRPHTTYYYAVAARDNVSGRRGRRSPPAKAKTR